MNVRHADSRSLIRTALVAHPSADLYGSDLQMLESVKALKANGWNVVLTIPTEGPLCSELGGVDVRIVDTLVLRKSLLRPLALILLVLRAAADLRRAVQLVRSSRPDVIYVSTLTIPIWLLAGRLTRTPIVTHVHEAENSVAPLVRRALIYPLLMSHRIIANSMAASTVLSTTLPKLEDRVQVIYNGVDRPSHGKQGERRGGDSFKLVFVGRLAPRKGVDIAIEAVAELLSDGYDVYLDVYGSTFEGYELYEQSLRQKASTPRLDGRVSFHGYVREVGDVLANADALLVPSRQEPFGNVAVEGMMCGVPVVASKVQGLQEIVNDSTVGILVEPDDPRRWAEAIASLLDQPERAALLGRAGQRSALERFGVDRYAQEINAALHEAVRHDAA